MSTKTDRIRGISLILIVAVIFCGVFAVAAEAGEDWPGFRGADGSGKAVAKGLPTTWDSNKNIVWKTDLPGPGTSSPIVIDSKIYLTSYSGYAENEEEPGETENLVRHLVCLDRKSGKMLWSKPLKVKMPESKYSGGNSSRHGYASSTIATDGEGLYIFTGLSGMNRFDLDGNVQWTTDLGSGTHGWGSATSPVLYKNLVIVNASVESSKMYGLERETGKIVWEAEGVAKCWSSPMLVDVGGKQELVLNVPKRLTAYDPATGKELWYCDGLPDSYLCPSVVSNDGVVYAIGARKNTSMAVRCGGRGDVTDSHVLWKVGEGSIVSSPVYIDGYLYWFHEKNETAFCLDAKTGEVVYEEDLSPASGLIYASVTAADGKLYAPSQENGTYVLEAGPKFKQLAVNKFQDDNSRTNASIIVTDNQLILRSDKAIYCIGQ
jgi:hypothetical protein